MYKLSPDEIEDLRVAFLEILHIDNPSGEEEKAILWIQTFLQTHGFSKAEVDDHRNMLLKIDGTGDPLLLCAHTDGVNITVGKEPRFEDGSFITNGKTILSADDLAGVISVLYTLLYFKKYKIEHRPLEILFVSEEEVSGVGIKKFDITKLASKECLLPDLVGDVGRVGIKAPSKWIFNIIIRGKAAHVKHSDKGISAIKMMADLVHHLPLGYVDEQTTLNIGVIQGGKGVNVIPDEVDVSGSFKIYKKGEVRGFDDPSCARVVDMLQDKINEVGAKYPEAHIAFEYHQVRQAYEIPSGTPLLKRLQEITEALGIPYEEVITQGLSDGADLNGFGIETAVIGVGYENAHTVKETISLDSLTKLTEQLINFCAVDQA